MLVPMQSRKKTLIVYMVGVLLLLSLAIGVNVWSASRSPASSGIVLNQPLPRFRLNYLNPKQIPAGQPAYFDSQQMLGKVWVINLWASWCPPCREEWPLLTELNIKGTPVVGINDSDERADALKWLKAADDPFTHSLRNDDPPAPGGGSESASYSSHVGSLGLPSSYLIDQKGIVRARYVGPLPLASVEQKISELTNKH